MSHGSRCHHVVCVCVCVWPGSFEELEDKLSTDDLKVKFCEAVAQGPPCFGDESNRQRVLAFCLNLVSPALSFVPEYVW